MSMEKMWTFVAKKNSSSDIWEYFEYKVKYYRSVVELWDSSSTWASWRNSQFVNKEFNKGFKIKTHFVKAVYFPENNENIALGLCSWPAGNVYHHFVKATKLYNFTVLATGGIFLSVTG